jgi:hypothetical protein
MRYFKIENNKIIEAPYFKEVDGKKIYGYNKPSNEKMLLADGYIPCYSTLPTKYLEVKNGEIVEKYIPGQEESKIYSKLKIRRTARAIGKEDILNNILNTNENFYNDWNDAQEIDLDDLMFNQLSAIPEAQEFIEEMKTIL